VTGLVQVVVEVIKRQKRQRLYRTVLGVLPIAATVGAKDCTGVSRTNGN
jgi:hypothetical protein